MELSESFFDTGELNLRVFEGPPSGPPLVLLHGSTGGWSGWFPLLSDLMEHWHVYVPDLRGHEKSGRTQDQAGYHLNVIARDILALIRGRVREPAVLFGHSWGAVTAT